MSAPQEPPRPPANGDEAIARRKLLRAGAYLAPAILGALLSRSAFAQYPSCSPAMCNPNLCGPGTEPCGPAEPCGPNECTPSDWA